MTGTGMTGGHNHFRTFDDQVDSGSSCFFFEGHLALPLVNRVNSGHSIDFRVEPRDRRSKTSCGTIRNAESCLGTKRITVSRHRSEYRGESGGLLISALLDLWYRFLKLGEIQQHV